MNAPQRIIKKYPNRRLYDTATGLYINLDDVHRLVLSQVDLKILDQRTGEDLTRATLLQIISEQEDHGSPLFSVEALARIIRMYGQPQQTNLATFLENSLALFMEHQLQIQEQLQRPLVTAVNPMASLIDHNMALWKKWQESLLVPFTPTEKPKTD